MSKALLYVRVSTKDQEEGYSLDAQEKLGYEYAKGKGLTIVKMWKVSESAWKTDRKNFIEMINYAKKNEIKNIIFDVSDRMSRNMHDFVKIEDLVSEHNIIIHFSRTNKTFSKESKPDEQFMFGMDSLMARKYSSEISVKAKMGMAEKISQGGYCHVAPVGYVNNIAAHTIEIDPAKAPFVKKAFEMMASGQYSFGMMCETLYNQGLRSKRGLRLQKGRIQYMLKNPIYYGAMFWHDKVFPAAHEPIISKELFDRVQEMTGKKPRVSNKQDRFPFNSLLTCGLCGRRIIGGQYNKIYHFYHCTFSKGRHPGVRYLREDRLADILGEELNKVIPPDDMIDYIVETVRKDSDASQEGSENLIKSLYSDKTQLENRINRLYDDKLDNKITEAFWNAKNEDLKKQITSIEDRIRQLGPNNDEKTEKGLTALENLKCLKNKYKNGDLKKKAEIMKSVASNFLYSGEKLSPVYKKPFDVFAEGPVCIEWRE